MSTATSTSTPASATKVPSDEFDDDLTIIVTNFNGRAVLGATLQHLRDSFNFRVPVLLVDGGSSDGSAEWARREFPEVTVVLGGDHTKRLNMTRNVGLRAATTKYVFLMDNDILVPAECITELMTVMKSTENVLCCTPRLVYRDHPETIYSDGNSLHFLCVSGASSRDRSVSSSPPTAPHPTFGGGIMLIDRERAEEIGFFDEGYLVGWADDAEFQLRGRLNGFQSLHVPRAVCIHSEKNHGTTRSFGQVYNRYRLLLTVYSARTLILLAPALLVFEFGLMVLSITSGFAGAQISAVREVWKNRRALRARRRDIQESRHLGDAVIIETGAVDVTGGIGHGRLTLALISIVTGVFNIYWYAVRRLVA